MPETNAPSGGADTAAREPPVIPGHKLLRRIGRGSYGEVWIAQAEHGEFRAVKIVFRSTFERDRPFEREFSGIQKFEPVSRAHPSQVSILQVGREDEAGFFYYVMELADDERTGRQIDPATYKPKTLRSEVVRSGRISYDRALDISLALTKALEHLHAHDLIHRDIKPSNIIFVNGVPKLADIGLVTDVGASISYVGTEGFLPPEGPVSQQADIYSLGKVLYEISTGQDRLDFPELPTFLGESAEKDGLLELNLVFLKSCQNDPHKRYRTAREMHADLAILRSGKSLKSARAAERRLKRVARVSLALAVAALCVGLGLYAWNQYRIKKLRDEVAQRERDRVKLADATRDSARQVVDGYLRHAEELRRGGDASGALAWHARALEIEIEPDRAEAQQRDLVRHLERLPKLVGFVAHGSPLNSATFNHDANRIVTAGADATVRVWDLFAGTLVGKPLKHKSPVLDVRISPENERVFSVCHDGTAWLWRLSGDSPVAFEVEHGAKVLAGEFSPNGRFLLTRGDDKRVTVWDGISARSRLKFDHDDIPADAHYSPDGQHVTVAAGNKLTTWETERGTRVAHAIGSIGKIDRIAFDPEGRRVIAVAGKTAQLWNVTSGEWAAFSIQEITPITAAAFSRDGKSVAIGTEGGTSRGWDTVRGQWLSDAWEFGRAIRDLEMSPDAAVVLRRTDTTLSLADTRTGRPLMGVASHRESIRSAQFTRDARLLLSASADGVAWVTELVTGATNDIPEFSALSREQLIGMTRLVSGREVNEKDQMVDVSPERLMNDWRSIRNTPALQPTPKASWHMARAERLESDGLWFGVRFHAEELRKLNADDDRVRAWSERATVELARIEAAAVEAVAMPTRSPDAKPNLIDLSRFYNVSLTQTWLPMKDVGRSNDLAQLPGGLQKLVGVQFDVRGLIQLSGSALENLGGRFPQKVTGIPVNRRATRIHFLHGTAWDALYGTVIGKYQIHYTNGEMREAKIVFGRNVRDWWFPRTQPQLTMEAAVAWQGENPASRQLGMATRVYKYMWTNPLPDEEITSIDFLSMMEKPAPFLLAITTEPAN
jgi:WD40 repeat protein